MLTIKWIMHKDISITGFKEGRTLPEQIMGIERT